MGTHILRGLTIAILTSLFSVSTIIVSTKPSYANVKTETDDTITIFNTITKKDAADIASLESDLGNKTWFLQLDSTGGDVDAAMQIGRIIRQNEGTIFVPESAKCYSSCALIYIAGVTRSSSGVIGLHRPYLASAPQSRQSIERETPLMLQQLKRYVQEMGITDLFYQEMVNTEPSNMKLYVGPDIEKIVPLHDPTYDEVITSYLAREYGIDTAEIRARDKDSENCFALFPGTNREITCYEAIMWGLSERVYEERKTKTTQCKLSDEEKNTLKLVKRNEIRDLPLYLGRNKNTSRCPRA